MNIPKFVFYLNAGISWNLFYFLQPFPIFICYFLLSILCDLFIEGEQIND